MNAENCRTGARELVQYPLDWNCRSGPFHRSCELISKRIALSLGDDTRVSVGARMSAIGTKRTLSERWREVRCYRKRTFLGPGCDFRLSRGSLKAGVAKMVASPPLILDGSSQLPPRTFLNKSSPGFEPAGVSGVGAKQRVPLLG